MKRNFFAILGVSTATLACAVIGTAWLAATKEGPVPQTHVGFSERSLTLPDGSVTLPLHIWYPTDAAGGAELIAQNALFYGFHAHRDAPQRAGAAPLVVLSHGSGGKAIQQAWLATALAERGFIVAGVNYPGTTSQDSDPHKTVKIWERPAYTSALLDAFEEGRISGLAADMSRVASAGFSIGGHTALALAGVQVSKARFIDYCTRYEGQMDCGWLADGGVDFTQIDQARYEASFADARIKASIAIDPALPQAMTDASLLALDKPVLLINFQDGPSAPAGVDASELAQKLPNATYITAQKSWHFTGLPQCSALGKFVIGVAGEDNICADIDRPRMDIQSDLLEQILPFADHMFDDRLSRNAISG